MTLRQARSLSCVSQQKVRLAIDHDRIHHATFSYFKKARLRRERRLIWCVVKISQPFGDSDGKKYVDQHWKGVAMKKLLTGAAVAAAIAGTSSAFAADMPVKAPPPAPAPCSPTRRIHQGLDSDLRGRPRLGRSARLATNAASDCCSTIQSPLRRRAKTLPCRARVPK